MLRALLVVALLAGCSHSRAPAPFSEDQEHELAELYHLALRGEPGALSELERRAELGEPNAQNWLAGYYMTSTSEPARHIDEAERRRKRSEAAKWHEKAARRGLAHAQFSLANHYLAGRGVERDPELGMAWLRLAADRGHARALFQLGYEYRRPYNPRLGKDIVQTYRWWLVTKEQLVKSELKAFVDPERQISLMEDRLNRLAQKMTAAQIEEAERLAAEFRAKSWAELRSRMPR